MPSPSQRPARRSPAAERRDNTREHEAIRRDRPRQKAPTPLVHVEPAPASHWPPGAAWLDTSAG